MQYIQVYTQGFREGRLLSGPELLRAMSKRSGKKMRSCLKKMSEYLATRRGLSGAGELEPIVKTYLTSVLLPAWGPNVSARNEAELRFLAEVMDALLVGNIGLVGDLLAQLFKAVEAAQTDRGWQLARHLQTTTTSKVTSLPEGERVRLLKAEEKAVRRRSLEWRVSKNSS